MCGYFSIWDDLEDVWKTQDFPWWNPFFVSEVPLDFLTRCNITNGMWTNIESWVGHLWVIQALLLALQQLTPNSLRKLLRHSLTILLMFLILILPQVRLLWMYQGKCCSQQNIKQILRLLTNIQKHNHQNGFLWINSFAFQKRYRYSWFIVELVNLVYSIFLVINS